MTFRDIRVRKRLHEFDRSKSSYGTVPRTGDRNRIGNFNVVFDDTNTVIFRSGTLVNFPTTLPVGSIFATHDMTSSLTAPSGTVKPSSVEQWIVRSYEAERFQAFNEGVIPEYDMLTTEFFKTGSQPIDAGLGFVNSLGSKTIIRLELPLTGKTTMLASTASSYYYDYSTKKFEEKNRYTGAPGAYFGICGETVNRPRNLPQPREELLFGPLGKYSTHVINRPGAFTATAPPIFAANSIFFLSDFHSSLTSSLTTPTGSQRIPASTLINQPFLLEKAVIEFPFEAGPGWFADATQIAVHNRNSIDPESGVDLGGPAITFGMFNHVGNDIKDLILSGTLIPANDDRADLQLVTMLQPTAGTKTVRSPLGFRNFSTPTTVVRKPSNSIFSGTVRMLVHSAMGVGVTTAFHRLGAGNAKQDYNSASFDRSTMILQNTVGRNKNVRKGGIEDTGGRSILGKTMDVPSVVNILPRNLASYQASGTVGGVFEDIVSYTSDRHRPSPYLIMPKDFLFFTLSKYRPAFTSATFGIGPAAGAVPPALDSTYFLYHSTSHDVSIPTGSLKITLYGSMVREEKEFHDVLPARLDTNQVHETIGAEPVLDEHDIFYRSEMSGSIFDRYITGSIYEPNTAYARQVIFYGTNLESNPAARLANGEFGEPFDIRYISTALQPKREVVRNVRFIQCNSENECFFDSTTPDIPAFVKTGGGAIQYDSQGAGDFNEIRFGEADDVVATCWPFEPKFANVPRTTNDRMLFTDANGGYSYRSSERNFTVFLSEQLYFADLEYGAFLRGEFTFAALSKQDLLKVIFGFGSTNRAVANLAGGTWGSTTFMLGRAKSSNNVQFRPEIRGWRRGLMSAFPVKSKAVFRRNRYGHLRDMLEQRQDGKFYIEGNLSFGEGALDGAIRTRFVNSAGETVLPYETTSSNLSFEMTSSIPCIDGTVTNREEPMTFAKSNQVIVVI